MRTATGLHVYTYGLSIIARLDQLRAVQMMLNVVKLSVPCLAQSEPGQPGEMTHGSQHPCWPPHSILGARPSRIWAGIYSRVGAQAHFMRWAQPILRLSRRACARANAGQPLMKNLSHFVKSVLYLAHI